MFKSKNFQRVLNYLNVRGTWVKTAQSDGLIKLSNGGVYTERNLSNVRYCFDTIYGEFDGYGEGDRKLIIMINIDNSAL